MRYIASVGEQEFRVEVEPRGGGRYRVILDGRTHEVTKSGEGAVLLLTIDGAVREVVVAREGPGAGERAYGVTLAGRRYPVRLIDPLRRAARAARPAPQGPVEVRATMPGKIVALLAQEGQEVRSGEGVVVVEAMKMENELPAPKDGRVTRLRVRPGETVEAGAALFTVE